MKKDDTNDLFEQLLREGASLAAEEMGKNAPEDNTDFSEEHKAKMRKLFARERRGERIKKVVTYSTRIAAVLVIVVSISGVAFFRVDALRVRILNMFTNTESTNTKVRFNEGEAYSTEGCIIGYIPEGFEVSREKIIDDTTFLKFKSGDEFFSVFIRRSQDRLSLDTEDADAKTVNLNGRKAFYTKKDDTNILTGYLGDATISLTGNIEKNTLYKIYQNIEFN